MNTEHLGEINQMMRGWILRMTTNAGSGHPTSSLSSVELMSTLFFGGFFSYNADQPDDSGNDQIIFSKGHASPLYYSLWAAAGLINEEELFTYRDFWSRLEGHPTQHFPYTFAATGSLGQGLSIGLGAALAAERCDYSPSHTWVLLGDSEMAEGQVWEAMQLAAHYKTSSLTAIVDVNRLGQRGETMTGHEIEHYTQKANACGWRVHVVDGHNINEITEAYSAVMAETEVPTMIIAKTFKGKGVSLLEDQEGWHGKVLNEKQLKKALKELGEIDYAVRGHLTQRSVLISEEDAKKEGEDEVEEDVSEIEERALGERHPVRNGYGLGLEELMRRDEKVVVLDAEVSNSTRSAAAKEHFPERFFEMYIAEQNMAGVAHGFAAKGYVPYISTFAAFFSRAHDQIRMATLDERNMVCVGSHAGVAIGEDGGSQMGLTDIAFFRSLLGSTVLCPADMHAAATMTVAAAQLTGTTYIRTLRQDVPLLYPEADEFPVGGSKVLCASVDDTATIIAMGTTVHEALEAYDILKDEGVAVRVIDAYSVKPIDTKTIKKAAAETHRIIVVEDHFAEGALGDAVRAAIPEYAVEFTHLCVCKPVRSGTARELLAYEEIDASAIVRAVRAK